MTVKVRHMQKADLSVVVETERLANAESFEVPGVGRCEALAPWAWTEHDFLSAVRRYRSRSKVVIGAQKGPTPGSEIGK